MAFLLVCVVCILKELGIVGLYQLIILSLDEGGVLLIVVLESFILEAEWSN